MNHKLKQIIQQQAIPLKISFGVSLTIILLSLTGIFQVLEWAIFDQFFRIRPEEKRDERTVIVSIDETDITRVGHWPISDEILTRLLNNIKAQEPRVIGLDIFRDLPVTPGHEQFVELMESTPYLIGVEKFSGDTIPPPPTLAKLNQVAAADLISDGDGKIRRALLSIKPENSETKLSLGAALAVVYLAEENITLQLLNPTKNKYQLGKAVFFPLRKNDGAYINTNVGGYQIILNYLGKPCNYTQACIFKTVSMTDVLQGKIEPDLMKDKIVLIGVTARSISDFFYNPYSYSDNTTITGVEIHAHLSSLIINAALEGNHLMKTVPEFMEWLWILGWSSMGAVITAKSIQINNNAFYLFILNLLLVLVSYILFLMNWWIPLVTPLMAMIIAATTSLVYNLWENLNISYQKLEQYASSLEDKVQEKTKDLLAKQIELKQKNLQLESQNIKLIEARKMADSANEAKSRFLANMSHELRTPLNAIIGFSQLMNRDKDLNVNQKEFVEIINRSGEHLLSLINDILDLSKIEANKITFNEEEFDLFQMLQTVKEMLTIKAQAKNLCFLFNIDQNVPRYIVTDQKKLRQIVLNLLSNAIKFTDRGSVELNVYLQQEANILESDISNFRSIFFLVKDTGKGIKKEELSKLFQPFEQTEAGKNAHEGTGLGLAISHKFVQLLGGDIRVESKVNQGTIFSFNIRAKLMTESEPFPVKQARGKVIGLAPEQPNYRILVVDDQPNNRLLLLDLLNSVGFSVQQASNGREATDIWQTWHPHLIWMDLQMPGLNGYEATKKIRQWESDLETQEFPTKIIAISANALKENQDLTLASGFDDYVLKPFQEEVIWEKMSQYLAIEFIYQQLEDVELKRLPNTISPEQVPLADLSLNLKDMPHQWLTQLYQASSQLKGKKVMQLIKDIPPEKAAFAGKLQTLAENYRFDEIVKLLGQKEQGIGDDLQQMPLDWLNRVTESANKGSDRELLELIAEIPLNLVTLTQVFTHLTKEFRFDEIVRLISHSKK